MQIYVDGKKSKSGDGTREYPFVKISEAAQIARPGDQVIVAPGIYRESVNPKYSGTEQNRITYQSSTPKGAVITGAERMSNWTYIQGTTWKVHISNDLFNTYNPYTTLVKGDWFNASYIAHTGEVYLNGKSMYEVTSKEQVYEPIVYKKSWDPEFTVYTWYTEQDETTDETIIYANFQGKNPNHENVEINVREKCFYPEEQGIGYITLSGFVVKQAATQWAPPTAYQIGMVGPHWSKGWIIEDCEICDSKCSGISLGKYKQPSNDNKWTQLKYKDGTQTERECICLAQLEGWDKEHIGSHIIRRCDIHDCGQTGIVGHLGAVFSEIVDNHIHHINNKQNLSGAEIGGIKLHAAIDVLIQGNHIHHCTRGLWLDWQAQGTRVTKNAFHDNTLPYDYNLDMENGDVVGEDLFIEVSHGPTLVDHNFLLSDHSLKLPTQGVAIVHNLIAGAITAVGRGVNNGTKELPSPRYTPYHQAHSTAIAGFMTILHGDVKFYNNIFVQKPIRLGMKKIYEASKDSEWTDNNILVGTHPYSSYPTESEYKEMFQEYCGMGSKQCDRYYMKLPVWASGNVYFNQAKPMEKEQNYYEDKEHTIDVFVEEGSDGYLFRTNLYQFMPQARCNLISTRTLGIAFEPEQRYENADGSPIVFDYDFLNEHRLSSPVAGPLEAIDHRENEVTVVF